jgi:hypothetical protein
VAGHALRCARGMGYGGVVLHSHTQVRPTFPFVQFKPLGVGERIRAVLSAQAVGSTLAANTVSCKETNHGRRKQSGSLRP